MTGRRASQSTAWWMCKANKLDLCDVVTDGVRHTFFSRMGAGRGGGRGGGVGGKGKGKGEGYNMLLGNPIHSYQQYHALLSSKSVPFSTLLLHSRSD